MKFQAAFTKIQNNNNSTMTRPKVNFTISIKGGNVIRTKANGAVSGARLGGLDLLAGDWKVSNK
jgi:hypothetical protein